MPSSHSSTVSALAVAIGLQEGFGASAFAVALILACVVWFPCSFFDTILSKIVKILEPF